MTNIRNIIFKLHRRNHGQVFILTLVLLLIGSLLIPSLLSYMSTGLKIERVYEQETDGLYAADAGVNDAIWQLKHATGYVPVSVGNTCEYDLSSDINGCQVSVQIGKTDSEPTYRITSVATTDSNSTTVIADIYDRSVDLSGVMQQVITSLNGYTEQGGHADISPPSGQPHGPVTSYTGEWADASQLTEYYIRFVDTDDPYPASGIDVAVTSTLGNTYVDGSFDIESSVNGATLTLNGTLFLTDDSLIGQTGQSFTLNLNNQAIFVASSTPTYALRIGGKCTIAGSGAIIAVGGIEFMPNINSGSSDYLFLMSAAAESYIKPNGVFYGTVAGSSIWDQNAEITWSDPSAKTLNIPGVGLPLWAIETWDIKN